MKKDLTKTITKKLSSMTPKQTVADVLNKEELEAYTRMCAATSKAEYRALPISRLMREQ